MSEQEQVQFAAVCRRIGVCPDRFLAEAVAVGRPTDRDGLFKLLNRVQQAICRGGLGEAQAAFLERVAAEPPLAH